MEQYVFGQAKPEDCVEINTLFREAVRILTPQGLTDWDDEYPAMEHIEDDQKCGDLYCLRGQDGQLLAAITVHEDVEGEMLEDGIAWREDIRRYCVLSRLCVSPRLQGRGIGGAVLERAERVAREMGCDGIRLFASRLNPVANALYIKRGYENRGRVFKYETDFNCYELAL